MNKDSVNRAKIILNEIPPEIQVVAAAKQRTAVEVSAIIQAGIVQIGHNYLQQAEEMRPDVPEPAIWRLIGHLQTNKAKKALDIFDTIDTLDSLKLASKLDVFAREKGKVFPVLIEVNSGRESNKHGVLPENLGQFISSILPFQNIQVGGLMTMGPFLSNSEDYRPFFRETFNEFSRIRDSGLFGEKFTVLSMGMSDSYQVAIEEGATMVRIGTKLFGPRQYK
ncbi:MAG: YggS family pyridoxal phosphate-dependent enzyme [Anaerolineales bacterium]|nr:YggS family pyridoxal phosphate-dependent enzyme [Anaerolineales bacterium]